LVMVQLDHLSSRDIPGLTEMPSAGDSAVS